MTQPQLRVRGAASDHLVNAMDDDVVETSDDDGPPALEPAESGPAATNGNGRVRSSRTFTIYRQQGTSTAPTTVDLDPETPTDGRSSRLSHWSTSTSDSDSPPPLIPEPTFSLPWDRQALGNVTCLEQYLVIVADGERLFFRMSIILERTLTGFRPTVNVDFMNYVPAKRSFQTDVWLLFAAQLESTLLREVDRAFRLTAARRGAGL